MAEERLKALASRGHQVTILTAGAKNHPSREQIDGIQVYRSPFVGANKASRVLRRFIFWFWSLGILTFTSKVDVVHFNSLPGFGKITSSIFGAIAAWIAHNKRARTVYVHSLASEEDDYFTRNSWDHFFLNLIDHLVCVSDGLYQAAKIAYPTKARKILYGVRNDIFSPIPSFEKDQLRHHYGVDESNVVFTFLGSVGRRKGFDLIATAFSEIYLQHKNWRLWVVGPRSRSESQNIDEQEVAQVTSPLRGLDDAVKYWGRIDDRVQLARIFGASDIFIFPTRREGMPISPMEAMSAGLPIIISYIPGITDLVNIEGETGYYIKPGNESELISAMLKLAENSALRETMGHKARERIVNEFSWQQHIDRWEQLYLGKLND